MDSAKGSTGTESLDVDEWDENFINEVFQFELGLTSKNTVAHPADPPHRVNPSSCHIPEQDVLHWVNPSQPFPSERGGLSSSRLDTCINDVCFSPPRELSQRFSEISEAPSNVDDGIKIENRVWRNGVYNRMGAGRKNKDVERLKEQDCITFKKDRDKKREQLKCISQLEDKDTEIYNLKTENSGTSIQNQSHSTMSFANKAQPTNCVFELKRRVMLDDKATTSCVAQECSSEELNSRIKCRKTKGIQTDINQDSTTIIQQKRLLNGQRIVSNLHAIWGLCDERSGNTLVSMLLRTCSEDFLALFRCVNMPSNCNLNGHANENFFEMAMDDSTQSIHLSDAAKAFRFYQTLMKMRHEIVPPRAIIDALLELCNLDNINVAHVSLRILHATLQHLGLGSSSLRSNVFVGQSNGRSFTGGGAIIQETPFLKSHAFQMADNANEAIPVSSLLGNLCMGEDQNSSSTRLLPFESSLRIFEMMQKIVTRNLEEYIQLEGLLIMSLIMMESKPNSDREKFCSINLLQTLSTLIHKEAGVHVRKQAVRLLFLLFNCPKMLILHSGRRDGSCPAKVDDTQMSTAKWQGEINSLLGNIAECLTLNISDAEELKFRRRVIILLAFVASSGKNGFELLLRSVTSQQINFLELIIRLLAFEMDAEIPIGGTIQNFCKERISLIREALILLNRLTSHPTYSEDTLRALTGTRATSSLTIEIANRLPRRTQCLLKQQVGTKRTQASVEIGDLTRLFRARVFSFLGVPVS